MNELGHKNTEKSDILPSFFYADIFKISKKIFVKGKNMYILAIDTHF